MYRSQIKLIDDEICPSPTHSCALGHITCTNTEKKFLADMPRHASAHVASSISPPTLTEATKDRCNSGLRLWVVGHLPEMHNAIFKKKKKEKRKWNTHTQKLKQYPLILLKITMTLFGIERFRVKFEVWTLKSY